MFSVLDDVGFDKRTGGNDLQMMDPGISQGVFDQLSADAPTTQRLGDDGVVVVDHSIIKEVGQITHVVIQMDLKAVAIVVVFNLCQHVGCVV